MLFSYLFLAIVLFASYFLNSSAFLGRIGEKKVRKTLSTLNQQEYKIFHDLYILREDRQTSQIDHVVLSLDRAHGVPSRGAAIIRNADIPLNHFGEVYHTRLLPFALLF